jgi:hypothetical protein
MPASSSRLLLVVGDPRAYRPAAVTFDQADRDAVPGVVIDAGDGFELGRGSGVSRKTMAFSQLETGGGSPSVSASYEIAYFYGRTQGSRRLVQRPGNTWPTALLGRRVVDAAHSADEGSSTHRRCLTEESSAARSSHTCG